MEDSFFAPPNRASKEKINADYTILKNAEVVQLLINALPDVVAILNKERQIVFGNKVLLKFLGMLDEKDFLGLRLGEAVHCVNSGIMNAGCGTSEKCRYCGAVNAIWDSQKTLEKVSKECRITTLEKGKNDYLDLQVTATPFVYMQQEFTILTIEDKSDSKRRAMLERIFFHDIINIAGGLKGVSELLSDTKSIEETDEYIGMVGELSTELLEEIVSQRALAFAESKELQPVFTNINSLKVFTESLNCLKHHNIAESKLMIFDEKSISIDFDTDAVLLKRVLVNMLKNALEASVKGGVVTLNCLLDGESIVFKVHNDGFMPKEVQAQVFQRSFSTKGAGRGLGTYSIKLLTENYLNGKVSFSSSLEEGTTFMVSLNINKK